MNITTLNMTTLDGNVIIKKGGGGTPTPPSGESTIEYLDVSGVGDINESLINGLVGVADIVKSKNEEGTFVGVCLTGIRMLFGMSTNDITTCVAVAVDFSRHIKGKDGDRAIDLSIAEICTMLTGVTEEQLDSIPRITKEQFYDLNA